MYQHSAYYLQNYVQISYKTHVHLLQWLHGKQQQQLQQQQHTCSVTLVRMVLRLFALSCFRPNSVCDPPLQYIYVYCMSRHPCPFLYIMKYYIREAAKISFF